MSLCNQTFKGSKPCSPQGDGENVYKQEGFQVENWGLRINTNQTQNNNYTSQSDNDQNTKLLSFQICGLYNTEYNYLNSFNVKFDESNSLHSQEMINNSNSCQYINKEYDLFNLSSFNNLTYQNCPITSFKIIDIRSTQYQQGQNTYYLDIPQSDYMKFQVKRDPNAYPLSQISVQWGKGICLNSNWPEPIKNAQLDRDIAHVLQQTALNHAPRNEHARISSLLAINQNINNPNSIFQIRMDEDQDISEKGNTTKDTQSIKRNIDFY